MTVRHLVNDVDAALPFYRALGFRLAAGGRSRSQPIKGPGGRQMLIDDPSGNPVELFEAREG